MMTGCADQAAKVAWHTRAKARAVQAEGKCVINTAAKGTNDTLTGAS